MKNEGLAEKLEEYAKNGRLPMHMPGHKRNCSLSPYLKLLGAELDITEIDGFDNLNAPEGMFAESERLAAKLWGADESIFCVNGSTGAILAAVRAALFYKGERPKVLVARNCHKAVYHALEICGAEPVYINVPQTELGFCASVPVTDVEKAIGEEDISLVIITSPTYEGVISDVENIARVCHERGVPLMVDEAHGSHLGLHSVFEKGAVACGADIVVQSLHKTLPSLTQTAILHRRGELVSSAELRRQMAVFQTSSPSYILSASIDGAVRFMASNEGKTALSAWREAVLTARERLSCGKYVKLFDGKNENVFAYDNSKLVLSCDGRKTMNALRDAGVELEMAQMACAVAMTGIGDTADSLDAFCDAVSSADTPSLVYKLGEITLESSLPERKYTPSEALRCEKTSVPLEEAVGRVSGVYVQAYPPGIPLVVPGEELREADILQIKALIKAGAAVSTVSDGKISVLEE